MGLSPPTDLLRFDSGKHYCAVHASEEEWRAWLAAFVTQALSRNDRLVYSHHHHTADQVIAALCDVAETAEALARGQLQLSDVTDEYYRRGIFAPARVVALQAERLQAALAEGYAGLSATMECVLLWWEGEGAQLSEQEARLEQAVRGSPECLVCQYDRRYLPADTIAECLRTHQFVIYGGRVYPNRYYVCPELYLAAERESNILQVRLDSLREWAVTEQTLHESEERYRLIADSAFDWEYWTLPDGQMVYVSPACRRITGCGPEKFMLDAGLLGRLVHPEDRAKWDKHCEESSSDGGPQGLELRIIDRAGRTHWISHQCQPVRDGEGRTVGRRASNRDITVPKHDEDELRRHRDHLEDLVAHRTNELVTYQENLRAVTAELALAEERERRRIAAAIHDELCQTLAFMKMRLQSLPGIEDPLEVAAARQQLEALLDRCIQSSRNLTLELSPPVLYQMGFSAALEWLGAQMGQTHGYRVRVHTDDALDSVAMDVRVTLFQCVRELLTNAGKYSSAEQVIVGLQGGGEMVEVSVEDDGVGFDPQQVRVTATGGFGLFSIGERMTHLGGELRVYSAPGAGARFVLRAPARVIASAGGAEESEAEAVT